MVANKERGELPLTVGGTTYITKLTTNAVCQMETVSGRTFDQIVLGMQDGRLTDVRWFLWAVLLPHQPEMKIEQVGDLIDGVGLKNLRGFVSALIGLNTSEAPTAESSSNPQQAQDGTGVGSTSTLAVPA